MQGLQKKSKSKPKTPKRKKSIANDNKQTQLLNELDEVLNKVLDKIKNQ